MKNQYLRFALLASLMLAALTALAQQSQAQLLNKLRSIYSEDAITQYSPDDPSTRSRLFNLQTGHAGAFYNCDGEEDKRHSPYICWKNGPAGEKFHRPILDVINWKSDKDEIVQRICDGSCCNRGSCNNGSCNSYDSTVIPSSNPCGCAECLGAKSAPAGHATAVANRSKPNTSFRKRTYVNSKPQISQQENASGLIARSIPSVLDRTPVQQSKPCNCAKCKAERANASGENTQVVTKAPNDKPIATTRSASLLHRARSSRKQH